MTREQRLVTLAFMALAIVVVLALAGRATATPPYSPTPLSERLFADVTPAPRPAAITLGPSSGGGEPRDPGWLPTGAPDTRVGASLPARVAVPTSAPTPRATDAAVKGVAQTPATATPSPAISRKEAASAPKVTVGTATWYLDPAIGPDGYYAAVGSWRWGDDPYPVTVCTAIAGTSRCVTVHVIDACAACRDGTPLIDLSPAAFRSLGPLSAGVLRVEVTRP